MSGSTTWTSPEIARGRCSIRIIMSPWDVAHLAAQEPCLFPHLYATLPLLVIDGGPTTLWTPSRKSHRTQATRVKNRLRLALKNPSSRLRLLKRPLKELEAPSSSSSAAPLGAPPPASAGMPSPPPQPCKASLLRRLGRARRSRNRPGTSKLTTIRRPNSSGVSSV